MEGFDASSRVHQRASGPEGTNYYCFEEDRCGMQRRRSQQKTCFETGGAKRTAHFIGVAVAPSFTVAEFSPESIRKSQAKLPAKHASNAAPSALPLAEDDFEPIFPMAATPPNSDACKINMRMHSGRQARQGS